jgi:hypothetical protein
MYVLCFRYDESIFVSLFVYMHVYLRYIFSSIRIYNFNIFNYIIVYFESFHTVGLNDHSTGHMKSN